MNNIKIIPFNKARVHVGRWLLHLNKVESTNSLALNDPELLKKDGLIILADVQTKGRGRKARKWISHIPGNLYFSCIIHDNTACPVISAIPLIAGISLHHALTEIGVACVSIKWPNDVLIKGRKVAGILVEAKSEKRLTTIVVGIGLNIRGRLEDYPNDLKEKITTLEREGFNNIDKMFLLSLILDHLDRQISDYIVKGSSYIYSKWEGLSSSIGKKVIVTCNDSAISGDVVGLSPKGFLLIKSDSGNVIEIVDGDVKFV